MDSFRSATQWCPFCFAMLWILSFRRHYRRRRHRRHEHYCQPLTASCAARGYAPSPYSIHCSHCRCQGQTALQTLHFAQSSFGAAMVGIVPDPSQTKEHDTSTNHDTLTRWHEELLRRAGADVSSVLDRLGFPTPGATHPASESTSSCEGDMPSPYVQEASVE